MKSKRILWLVAGLLVGVSGVSAMPPAAQKQPPSRLQVMNLDGETLNNRVAFVKDPKSGGCWLVLRWDASSMTMAVAPKEACQ